MSGKPFDLERYTKPQRAEPASPDTVTADGYVAMLDLVLRNGNHVALPYATLLRAIFNPSAGISLVFAADDVVIEGRGLEPLYRGIVQHRVPKIACESGRQEFEQGTSETPVVTSIKVTPKDN
ncbi:MAG: hypothetical protein ACIAQ0_09220 [Phycisphaerales bacterium JB058]